MATWPVIPEIDTLKREVYAAIRWSADGYNWIDSGTVACYREGTVRKVEELRQEIPSWDAANKVVMIAKFRLEFIDRA